MTRKDSEKDSERPHYYSQFWLDVAAGRRIIGAPKPNDENDSFDNDVQEPVAPRRVLTRDAEEHDGRVRGDSRSNAIVHPVVEPPVHEEIVSPEDDFSDSEDEDNEDQNDVLEDADIPDMDLSADEDDDFYAEEEEEEDEEDWGKGRKKSKPARPPKPAPKRPAKRETRRNY